jgi:hypothetical protein
MAFVLSKLSKYVSNPGNNYILSMLKMFSDTFNFAKIIISSYLEEKLRKSYSSMVTVMLDGDALSKF